MVTGAGSGIGEEVARRLSSAGYELIVSGSNRDKLDALSATLARPARIEVVDLSDAVAVSQFCARLEAEDPPLDIAFINAGTIQPGDFVARERESLDREIDVNFRSAVHLIHACLRGMRERRRGHIIATCSMGGVFALRGSTMYSATKFALRGFLSGLQQEVRAQGITVSGLYPGAVDTPMLRYEAENGGSPLNFLHTPISVEVVGDVFMKLLEKGKLEVFVPYFDSLSARAVSCIPGILPYALPLFERAGERGRKRFIASYQTPTTP